jgi:hypothetical protein
MKTQCDVIYFMLMFPFSLIGIILVKDVSAFNEKLQEAVGAANHFQNI